MKRVFVSATSRDLKSYRQAVAEWACECGFVPVVLDQFPTNSDFFAIVPILREKISTCDAVIHLAGLLFGLEPTNVPASEKRRSYTQLEYELSKELLRKVFSFVARDDYVSDHPIEQTGDQRELQRQHRERLTYSNDSYKEFSTVDELRQLLKQIAIPHSVAKPINLPYGTIGTLFKGRDIFLERLRKIRVERSPRNAAAICKQVIYGLGGVGKTRAVVEYGWKYQHEYSALFFVLADSPENLTRNLADLCGATALNLPEQNVKEQTVQTAAVVRWLREHTGWFLILDNVDTNEAIAATETLLTRLNNGHVVITSRLSEWSVGIETLELDVLDREAAGDFLLERTNGKRRVDSTDAIEAQLLAQDVDGLALALEQAGAFIAKHRNSLSEYRARWQKQEDKVVHWFDARISKYPRSVATTWQTSINELGGDGRSLLNILCWLGPDPIPRAMIEKIREQNEYALVDVEAALANLTTYSLARWHSSGESVQIHRLVKDISRYRLPVKDREVCLLRALRMVDDFLPVEAHDVRCWPTCLVVRPHAESVIGYADSIGSPEPTGRIHGKLGLYLLGRAEHQVAELHMRRAVAIDEQTFGQEHQTFANDQRNLSRLLLETNRQAEAEQLARSALAIDERVFGIGHTIVARDLTLLAALHFATNQFGEAEPLMRRALAIDETSYGSNHPEVATDLNNLALLLKDTNRLGDAEPLFRRAINIDEAMFGLEHPRIARDLNNLALLLKDTNRLEEAEVLMRRALAIDKKSYGSNHPEVAIDLNNLAELLQATNRLNEAEPLFARSLAIVTQFTRTVGHEHPHLKMFLRNNQKLLDVIGISKHERVKRLVGSGVVQDGLENLKTEDQNKESPLVILTISARTELTQRFARELAIDERALAKNTEEIELRLSSVFPHASVIIVQDLYAGYRQRAGEFILPVEISRDGLPDESAVVKLGPLAGLQRELDGWESCRPQGLRRDIVLMDLQPARDESGKLVAIVYEDAERLIGLGQTITLESAILGAVHLGSPTIESVGDLLFQLYERLRLVLYRHSFDDDPNQHDASADGPIGKNCAFDVARIDGKLTQNLAAWEKTGSQAFLIRKEVTTETENVLLRQYFRDPVNMLNWIILQPTIRSIIPRMLRGRSHGDLHGRNVLVGRVKDRVLWPAVYDFANMKRDNLIGWDFVKMETEVKVRVYPKLFSYANFTSTVIQFEFRLFEETERARESGIWPLQPLNDTPVERLFWLLLQLRKLAMNHLGQSTRGRLWLMEYYFLLAVYGLNSARFDNLTVAEQKGAYLSAGCAAARFAPLKES